MSKASDARDERLEALHEALVKKTATLATSEGWTAYLEFAAKFHRYSLNNVLLILIQCPHATHVASYRKWAEMGRQVRKGEKSLSIFAPMVRKREDEKTGEEKRYVSGFRLVPVFDISQTDGDPVPEPVRPMLLDGEAPEGLWQSLAEIVFDNGYTLQRGPSQRGENGYTDPSAKVVQVTEGLSDAQACKTLIHEAAHMMLHCEESTLSADAVLHRNVAEVEAESVAYLVAQEHGLDAEAYTLPYIAGWSDGKSEVVAATADRVLKCAKTLIGKTLPAEEPVAV